MQGFTKAQNEVFLALFLIRLCLQTLKNAYAFLAENWAPGKYYSAVEPLFSERQPSGKPRLSGIFSEHQFFLFSKNMQPSENCR